MPLLVEHHKHRAFLLSYEQSRTVLFALAHFVGASAWSQDPQVLALRKDARALHDALRRYKWSAGWPP